MALTNYEKQKRWREKNRALYNLQQRNRRKKNLGGGEKSLGESGGVKTLVKTEIESEFEPQHSSSIRDTAQTSKKSTIKSLRELVKIEQEKPRIEAPTKPVIPRDDFGRVISEAQWNRLQSKKEKAKMGGYVLDEYSQ